MDAKTWFKEAKFGMMIHWGLYSVLGGEYNGRRTENEAEWIQSRFRIPIAEYEKLASAFNPVYFDAEEWVKLAKDAGMKYIVITSKHHEGFAMYKSDTDSFNVVDATPFGRDVIAEMASACRKYGIKLGLYYSQEDDWHEEHGGGYTAESYNKGTSAWCNDWDFPDNASKDYSVCFEKKIKPQVREILTKYGDICLIWFDNAITINEKQSKELRDLVKELQPNCLVNSRIGNGMGDYTSTGDNEIPEDRKNELWESPVTTNDSWGYKYFDDNWKTADDIIALREKLNSNGINLLLNVGPDHLGRIPAPCAEILREVGRRIKK